MLEAQAREHIDYACRTDQASHVDGEAPPGELVDDRQTLDLLVVGEGVKDEFVDPDMVHADWRQGARA